MTENRADTLAESLISVARQLRQASMAALAPWDITPSQARAIATLLRHPMMRLSELSDRLRIAPRSATEVVDGLQARDLIQRFPDPQDRRATLVDLTAAGSDLARTLQAARAADSDRFFSKLSEQDRAQLSRILRTLRA